MGKYAKIENSVLIFRLVLFAFIFYVYDLFVSFVEKYLLFLGDLLKMYFHQSIYLWLAVISVVMVCATTISDGNKFKENIVLRDEDNVILDKTVVTENDALSLEDQVHLLKNQMRALINQRSEDYKMLENSLKKTMKKNSVQLSDLDLKAEVIQLR